MQVFVYGLLLLGVCALVGCGVVLVTSYRHRKRSTRGMLAFGLGVALYFAVTGTLWVVAFAAPSWRQEATLTAAFLMIGWGVGLQIAARVIRWRAARPG